MAMTTGHDTYDDAVREAKDRNTHRQRKQNVAIFFVYNTRKPIFLVKDCGADYRPELPKVADQNAHIARVGMIDRRRMHVQHFSEA